MVTTLLLPLVAALAGVVSFSSPCCLPLIPSYLSYISALPVSDLGRREARTATLRAAVLFVAGFSAVFTLLGVSFAVVGAALVRHLPEMIRVAGAGIIVLGLSMAGIVRVPVLSRERRIDLARVPGGPRAAFLLGMAFALGWVPCIGPVLATVLTVAAAGRTAAWGGILLICYSAGLGLPFIALALGFQRAKGSLAWLRRHGHVIETAGGLMLVGVGILFVSDEWRRFFLPLQHYFARYGWPPI